jgi:hypothetical protein
MMLMHADAAAARCRADPAIHACSAKLGWVNTILPLTMAPKFLAVDAFFVFLMVQFFRGIPQGARRSRDDGRLLGRWRIYLEGDAAAVDAGAGDGGQCSPSSGPGTISSPR